MHQDRSAHTERAMLEKEKELVVREFESRRVQAGGLEQGSAPGRGESRQVDSSRGVHLVGGVRQSKISEGLLISKVGRMLFAANLGILFTVILGLLFAANLGLLLTVNLGLLLTVNLGLLLTVNLGLLFAANLGPALQPLVRPALSNDKNY